MKNIAILVLAAGKSSRMKGKIKQLEKINNKFILELILEKLQTIFSKNIFCVLGANSDKIKSTIKTKNVQFIENNNFETGLSSSIVSGINYLEQNNCNFDGLFILLADQPAIEITYLETMINLFEQQKHLIIASNYGDKLGVPALFPKIFLPQLLLIEGDKGARDFINKNAKNILFPIQTTNFFDIDTKEDLQLYKKSILK